jgi:DNA-binding transcriptional regulator GbsR (MarR family)
MPELNPVVEKFILHWGEMGTTWGLNRTVAQMYALLYLSPDPLTAEEISDTLSIARSTVSTGLHELLGWGVVRIVHVLGDRRDHYETINDVWETFRIIVDERKRREIDPTLDILRDCLEQTKDNEIQNGHFQARLQEMMDFFEVITTVYSQVEQLPTETLKKTALLGDNLVKVLSKIAKK